VNQEQKNQESRTKEQKNQEPGTKSDMFGHWSLNQGEKQGAKLVRLRVKATRARIGVPQSA
jgi:hypothetical protein